MGPETAPATVGRVSKLGPAPVVASYDERADVRREQRGERRRLPGRLDADGQKRQVDDREQYRGPEAGTPNRRAEPALCAGEPLRWSAVGLVPAGADAIGSGALGHLW